MGEIRIESSTGHHLGHEGISGLTGQAGDCSAPSTSQVYVGWTIGSVVGGGPRLNVGVTHEIDFFENLENPVHRGEVETVVVGRQKRVNLFGGGVPQVLDCGQYMESLGSVAKTVTAQHLLGGCGGGHAGRSRADRWLDIGLPIAAMS